MKDVEFTKFKKANKEKKQWFVCGCCGTGFDDYYSVQEIFDQDEDYGICESCQGDQIVRWEEQMDKLIIQIKDGLSEGNSKKFSAMHIDKQRNFAHDLVEKGLVSYSIGGR